MANWFVGLFPILLLAGQQVASQITLPPDLPEEDPITTPTPLAACYDQKSCETCVDQRSRNDIGNCLWEVTNSGQICVEKFTPSQEISNVAFNEEECKAIPTTTTTPAPPTPPYQNQCQKESTCESCVVARAESSQPDLDPYGNSNPDANCVWEVTSSGQICVEKYFPSQEISNVAFNKEGCLTIPSTTTAAPPKRDPCVQESTCESCVQTVASENDSTCIWIATNSHGQCANTYSPSEEIEKIAFTTNGCQSGSTSTTTVSSPTLVIPDSQSRCECTENASIRQLQNNADDQLNEIDDDIIVAQVIPVDEEQEKDELDYFGANVADRLRKVQYTSPKLATSIRYEIQKVLIENEKLLLKAPKRFFHSRQ